MKHNLVREGLAEEARDVPFLPSNFPDANSFINMATVKDIRKPVQKHQISIHIEYLQDIFYVFYGSQYVVREVTRSD